MSEAIADINESQPYDAQQVSEQIATGEFKKPEVNVEADYEASKEFSVSEIDRNSDGTAAAKAATAPKFQVHEPQDVKVQSETGGGSPDQFRDMAKELHPDPLAGSTVTDEIVEKAIDLGTPGR